MKKVSISFSDEFLENLKLEANKRDMPLSTYIKHCCYLAQQQNDTIKMIEQLDTLSKVLKSDE